MFVDGSTQELSLRGIVGDDVWGIDHGITTPHTLTANEDLLRRDSVISQQANDPLKALGYEQERSYQRHV
jgi:hypothetical protein